MTDAALTNPSTHAQVRLREPAGDRTFGETPTIGGTGADIVIPGIGAGGALQIARRRGVWIAEPIGDARVRIDGRAMSATRDLRRHDVIAVGDAQIVVTDISRTLLRIDVCHLVGNTTVPPASAISALTLADDDADLEIIAPDLSAGRLEGSETVEAASARSRRPLAVGAGVMSILLVIAAVASRLQSVALDLQPEDARVLAPGTWLALRMGARLFLLPGNHVVRAEHAGYVPAQTQVSVRGTSAANIRLRLVKLPGTLEIDTDGVASTVSVDGVDSGHAPGAIVLPPGGHTIAIRAPRHVDYIATIEIQGALARQPLKAVLQPSWGTLQVSAIPAGAHVSIDGADNGVAPAVVDAPSGVRRIRIYAPRLKTWESSVVLEAGEALKVGPVTLGQPDAHLALSSVPAGAEVTVSGTFRGRTPIQVSLPAGIQHEVMVSSPGYATWTRSVFAQSGKQLALSARLESVGARVTVQGEPDDAQLMIDGVDRGRTPQALELSATAHRIEVRKEGWVTFVSTVTPTQGFDRTLHYRLTTADLAPGETASVLYTQTGYMLRLVPTGTVLMALGQVTLKRPFYLGATEVTNEQFRRYRPDHGSGSIGRHAADTDDLPVTQVSWNDAAGFCNWLSERDSLPLAYEKAGDRYVLRRPVTIGYRLPTEAEWEYATRHVNDMSAKVSEWDGTEGRGAKPGFRVARYAE